MVNGPVEFWWIHSPEVEEWAGLRMATFFEVDGYPMFFIHNEVPERNGPRDWRAISERENWQKVEQIHPPTEFKHRQPRGETVQ